MTAKQPETGQGSQRILVVEDDSELAGLLDYYLRGHGYQVTCVSNGVEALRSVMETDYHAILCDMVMPRMPGDMFYMAVRRVRPQLCDRFIFLTAHQENARVKEFLTQMAHLVLRKPFHLDDLMLMLVRVFAAQEQSSRSKESSIRTDDHKSERSRRLVQPDI
jgi:two-component system, OmpR family, response regulator ResD